ncbi:hypothetical protein L596_012692 [Steinernema carpocapsae]|uniref:Uncharacterized protein n=1 Tax=Steinernema carpocapsae TaxID=34508 RepID=A0A4U5NXV8_STECR|nr:hypothetical protein L596_012692 [Steinernema carpocapsae]
MVKKRTQKTRPGDPSTRRKIEIRGRLLLPNTETTKNAKTSYGKEPQTSRLSAQPTTHCARRTCVYGSIMTIP